MTVGIIVQTRTGSTRLPGKVMMKADDKLLMIDYVINQLKHSKLYDEIVIATTNLKQDDVIFDYVTNRNILCFRGDEKNVLERHYQCAKKYTFSTIVRIPSDKPLIDPTIVDDAIEKFWTEKEATALRSVHEMSQTAYKSFQLNQNHLACLCTGSMDLDAANLPRQQFPKTYQPNGYVDVLKSEFILNNNQLHGNKVLAYITPHVKEVDVAEDFSYLLYQINHHKEMFSRLFDVQSNS